VLLDEVIRHRAVSLQGAQCGFFICAHQAAEALDISAEDGGELTLNADHRRAGGMRIVAHWR
jgi:hypothetical protein